MKEEQWVAAGGTLIMCSIVNGMLLETLGLTNFWAKRTKPLCVCPSLSQKFICGQIISNQRGWAPTPFHLHTL